MRPLIAVLVLASACGLLDVEPTTPTKLVTFDGVPGATMTGWCPRPPSRHRQATRSFEVTADLRVVKPLRPDGFSSYEPSSARDDRARGLATRLHPTIVGDTLRLSTYPISCHQTNSGCIGGSWSRPRSIT